MRRFRIFLSSMFSFLLLNSFVYALDNPHDASNSMTCSSCHFTSTDTPPWFTQPPDPENPDTNYPFNRLCWSCHNDTIAPYRRTHSNFVINGVEGWTQECRTCHNPHYQRQFRKWGSSSYLYSGTSTSVTPTTITRTGAGWTDNQWQGMVVIGNTSYPNYNYRILSNTSDTLTVQGTINTTYVKAGNTFAIVYGRLVKDYINSRYVRFFRNQGSNSFADGDTTYDGVCEVCHTQTTYHRNNASGDHTHNMSSNCAGCHSHTEGFEATCVGCHGYPPVDASTLVSNPAPTGSETAGAHNLHVNTKGYTCSVCHLNSGAFDSPKHNNSFISIGFSLFNGAYLGGNYDGQTAPNYDSSEANTTVSKTGTKTCTNIYCHSNAAPFDKPNEYRTVAWDGASLSCTSCHDGAGSSTGLSGRHGKHTDTATYSFACEKCHSQTVTGSSTISNQALHVNNAKDISFKDGGAYDTLKNCSNTYCHSDAAGGPPNVAVKWSDTTVTMNCDSCHKGRTTDTLTMSSNGHDRLVGKDWIRKYPCTYCHNSTVDSSYNVNYSKHVNGVKDIAIAPQWAILGRDAPSYDANTKTCYNVYCHSDGTSNPYYIKNPSWTSQHFECDSCHGHAPGSCSTQNCHDGVTRPLKTGWPTGEKWKAAMPMYPNTGPGTSNANSHMRHLLTDFTCDNCHALTVLPGSTCNTSGCHTGGGYMTEVPHVNPAYHVNKFKDVSFKAGGTYNWASKTCSNTACHTGGTDPQWGASVNTTIICLTCHGTTGGDVDDFGSFNGTQAKINLTEWATTGHGRPASSGNYASGNPPANFPGNPCWYCHDNNVLHKDPTNPFRLRMHLSFEKRFEKECVYCHMIGLSSECLGCHNSSESLSPQLKDLPAKPDDYRASDTKKTTPVARPDHTGYGESTSCIGNDCHGNGSSPIDDWVHYTGAGLWTAELKDDVKNQYKMMGVCLKCHEDDSNGICQQCHTGDKYKTGFDPGTGFIKPQKAKANSVHYGYKHFQQGTTKGGKFCWDCHDPHGDSNIYMIQKKVATSTDGKFGIPATRSIDVSFTKKVSGLDYARTSAPYNGICNVCHTVGSQHYRVDYGDGHNSGRVCTGCHEHRFNNSHASGQACNTCHGYKPVPSHTAFGLPRDCTKCHNGYIGKRKDAIGDFKALSHHVQGVEITNKHCYICHWEATELGLINTDYHLGYNYKTHVTVKDAPIHLVILGPQTRPTNYELGVTAVEYNANKIGTSDERTEVAKITQVCLSCHSDQNNDWQPYGDCKTPRQYAWDRQSIASRYSQTGTTTWGKYTATPNAAKKNIAKAYSAHGNAVNNAGGYSTTTGLDGDIPNTRAGTQNVQCFDCHTSHGSRVSGTTSSYVTFNGTKNGAMLKETQAGKSGYNYTYKAQANASGINPYNAGAGQCFDCHESANTGTITNSSPEYRTPWGYSSTFGATAPIKGYKDSDRFGSGSKGSGQRYTYKNSRPPIGGHLKASSPLTTTPSGTIDGLCTPCHDPHGVSQSLGSDMVYAVPLLKGTWMTSPYKEDAARPDATSGWGPQGQEGHPGVYTDQKTFGGSTRISENDSQFAGLCLRCHPKNTLTDGTNKNQPWKSLDRIHESVKGWGENTQHSYPCSKCHQAHNSGLPRLMTTNCLDSNHRGRVVSGGSVADAYGSYWSGPRRYYYSSKYSSGSFPKGYSGNGSNANYRSNCHPTQEGWPNNYWNVKTPW